MAGQNKNIKGKKLTISLHDKNNQAALIQFDGELTIYDINLVKDYILTTLKEYKTLELDLNNVTKLDSSGFQLLLACSKELEPKNLTPLIIFGPVSNQIKNIFNSYSETLQ